MPQKKTKNTSHRVKKRNVLLIALMIVVTLVVLGVIGKATINDVLKRQKLERQQNTLNQTLRDLTMIYNKFVLVNNRSVAHENIPDNRCSEISSKGTTKQYTCGTRAEIIFQKGNDELFQTTNTSLIGSVTDAFSIEKDYGIHEDERDNAQRSQLTIVHKATGQKCDIYGGLFRDLESYTTQPNDVRFSFYCNLEVKTPIFKIED